MMLDFSVLLQLKLVIAKANRKKLIVDPVPI